MATGEYIVYPAAALKWGLQHDGQILALFSDKAQALRAAIRVAQATAEPDMPTKVLSEAPGGESHIVWTFGKHTALFPG